MLNYCQKPIASPESKKQMSHMRYEDTGTRRILNTPRLSIYQGKKGRDMKHL